MGNNGFVGASFFWSIIAAFGFEVITAQIKASSDAATEITALNSGFSHVIHRDGDRDRETFPAAESTCIIATVTVPLQEGF